MAKPGSVSPEAARDFVRAVLSAQAMPADAAAETAALIVRADQGGWGAHGMARLPQYCDLIATGVVNPLARLSTLHDDGATALLSGDDGLGHRTMVAAVDLAIAKARSFGLGWVGVRASNHCGPMALYAARALAADCVAICGSTTSINHMAPWGGVEALLGTNPLCIAVPAGSEPPFVFDMSTSIVPSGRIRTAAARGETLPEGWMIDREGEPVTDPAKSGGATLLPAGGPKGYGLSLALALLAGVLNGAAVGRDVLRPDDPAPKPPNTGHFALAIRLSAFGDPAALRAAADAFLVDIRQSARRNATEPVRIPGDQIAKRIAESEANGLRLAPHLLAQLGALAKKFGVPPL